MTAALDRRRPRSSFGRIAARGPCLELSTAVLVLCATAAVAPAATGYGAGADDAVAGSPAGYPSPAGVAAPADQEDVPGVRPLQWLANQLPPAVSNDLDVEGWVWLSDLQNNAHPSSNYFDSVLSLEATKSFDQRLAVTAQGTLIDANGEWRVELVQGFASALLSDRTQTILTAGKFNANFGVEARDFWDRVTGTTSLLFNAEPQDLVGLMVTQPIGDTGLKVRPFLSADFQGGYNFDQPPGGGVMVEYQPNRDLDLAVTNWVGPGFVQYGGKPLRHPYPQGAYGDDEYGRGPAVVENWQGPNLYAERGGTLYFVTAKATWKPRRDLALSAQYLLGTTGTDDGQEGWNGWLLLADYNVTDRLHVWARWSALDDSDWFINGVVQKSQEVSGGVGYAFWDGTEVRVEYRHDFSNVTPDFDSVSIHLTVAF